MSQNFQTVETDGTNFNIKHFQHLVTAFIKPTTLPDCQQSRPTQLIKAPTFHVKALSALYIP